MHKINEYIFCKTGIGIKIEVQILSIYQYLSGLFKQSLYIICNQVLLDRVFILIATRFYQTKLCINVVIRLNSLPTPTISYQIKLLYKRQPGFICQSLYMNVNKACLSYRAFTFTVTRPYQAKLLYQPQSVFIKQSSIPVLTRSYQTKLTNQPQTSFNRQNF